ncbi:winged helix-turn-helix domain-containing protein [Amycolatopsis suaedae]|uniref:ArsR family transcriptional regulator n=1 Tax=Amycolatopsis suaedae TaxID=2510978 RepID=A0A4Q7JDR4_9PSEU|nr:helix-turn-helix domain-containing protein [Amycolatopsis suaedae]RZQ65577.1 ArsR family transcriptional regulator [Amycolatopsis suaedae]
MKDVWYLDRLDQAEALLKPQRVDVLRQLAEPKSCAEVGEVLGQTPQRVYYHVQRLVEAGLVTQVSQRRVRAVREGIYQAVARSFWLSPALVGPLAARSRDELSLGYLLDLVEVVQGDVARLGRRTPEREVPSLAVDGEVWLRPGQRQPFMDDLRAALQGLLTKYGGDAGEGYRVALFCYPRTEDDDE